MAEDQKIKTYFKPKSKAYRQNIPANQQDARNLRAQKRQDQTPPPSIGRSIGNFINRGINNFKENATRPVIHGKEHPPVLQPQSRRQQRDFVSEPFMGNMDLGMNFGDGGFGRGPDLSMHPDPMVSGMYRKEPSERVARKKKGGVTEIHHHHYH